MLTTPVPAGTKLAGISNAFGEEVQSSRLVIGETGDTAVGPDAPLPVEYPALLAAIEALLPGTGTLPAGAATDAKLELIRLLLAGTLTVGLPAGAATQATLLDLLAKIPASLGAKAASGSLSIVPATGSDLATGTGLTAVVTALAATLKVQTPIPAGVVAGQVAVTTSAAALPADALANGIVVKASASNTATIWIGGSNVTTTANGYPLAPGEAMSFAVANASAIYLIGPSGVAYFGGN
jgi:hypothetical protein